MRTFKQFINEYNAGVPVISTDKYHVDISLKETRDEINKTLRQVVSVGFVNPYMGLERVRKILANYNVFLPQIIFRDDLKGESIFEVSQFNQGSPEYRVNYSFTQNEHGIYDCTASISEGTGK